MSEKWKENCHIQRQTTRKMNNSVSDFIQENPEFIGEVLRHSDDTYTRACALVLLMNSNERSIEAVKREIERYC